jgi:phosphopantothenoylcysteine decarboxylase/phosphopantothenate--cysteine ligase
VNTPLAHRHILLGVSGGIAAYKAAELARLLRRAGAELRVVMTEAACAFVQPLTFEALTGQPARTTLLDAEAEATMPHIELARWAEAIVIAPASADVIARLALGLADDLLTTLCLASEAPLLVAPAMNRVMWAHPATQGHCATLAARGAHMIGPDAGEQACGEVGPGRMVEPAAIVSALGGLFTPPLLAGLKVLVTAGPTREPLDAVRFLSNRSSGRMGYAIAAAARAAGAEVTLVSGPVALTTPAGVARVDVERAGEMQAAVLSRVAGCDIFIACAAVADYRPATLHAGKLKKDAATLDIPLQRTPDIVAEVAALSPRPFLVGFAAETERLEENARAKLAAKHLDMVAANRVGLPDSGFDVDYNALEVVWPGGGNTLERAPKTELARTLIALIAERYRPKEPT